MNHLALKFDKPSTSCVICGSSTCRQNWATKSRVGNTFVYDYCKECDFAFINPRPTIESLGQYYGGLSDSTSTPSAAAEPQPVRPVSDAFSEGVIQDLLKLGSASGSMLDVGAGAGAFSVAAVKLGLRVTALEIDSADVLGMRQIPEITVVPKLFEDYEGPSESFDFILMSHVLEHAHQPSAWMEKAARLLKPGGVISIHLPHLNSLWRYIWGVGDPYFIPPEHLNHFSANALQKLSSQFGLKPVSAFSETHLPTDLLVRKFRAGPVVAPLIRVAGGIGLLGLRGFTRMTNTGAVLVYRAKKT